MWRKLARWGPAAAAASLAFPMAAVWIWHRSWWPFVLFACWTAATVAGIVVWQNRWHRERCEKLLTHAQLSTIRTLSHHRHDWMNELQILYGYLRLNKLDKAVDVVDRIRVRMDRDSKLSQIGYPELAAYFLSFRTICDSMRLEVDVQDGLQLDKLSLEADKLSRAIIGAVNVFRFRASIPLNGENVLVLKMSKEDGRLEIVLRYNGELAAAGSVEEELRKCLDGAGQVTEGIEPAADPHERTMVIHVPLSA